jgi:hypothetical protein
MNQYNMKYDNDLERYAIKHKLWISNELKHNQGEHFDENYDKGVILNYITVKLKDKTILRLVERGIIKDEDLLSKIKEVVREIKLNTLW